MCRSYGALFRSSGTFYQHYAPNGALSCRTSTEISQYATQN